MVHTTSLVLTILAATSIFASYNIEEDVKLDTIELLDKYGYPAERHYVTTQDGYILQLHRVPYSPLQPPMDGEKPRTPVFLQHGLLSSSADWVIMGPGQGFAYLLADAGYDVWMGNCRGNTYSRNHTWISPSQPAFWRFTWHEMGIYDLPAAIDYVLAQTGFVQLLYVGHSMGTTMFFVMGSQRTEYNQKIRAMFALAPIAYVGHMKSPFIRAISYANKPIGVLLEMMGIYEFLPSNDLMRIGGQLLCEDGSPFQALCENVLFLIGGYDSVELNSTMLPVITGHVPAGASTLTLVHYGQEVVSHKFRQYDYGTIKNLMKYNGWLEPPKYDLSKVTAPVSLHYSSNDWLASIKDVNRLYGELGNRIGKFLVPFSKFNHFDFVYAIHVKELLYDTVMFLMRLF